MWGSDNILKEEFNKLEIEEQVLYINAMLYLKTLTKICDELEVVKNTITCSFKRIGYTLNLEQNNYILDFCENKTLSEYNSSDIKKLKEYWRIHLSYITSRVIISWKGHLSISLFYFCHLLRQIYFLHSWKDPIL